jgi:hypothetical protein
MDSLEASHAAKRRRLALADGVKGQMELDALWSQLLWFELRSDLGEMEHRIALASAGGPHAMQAMEVSDACRCQGNAVFHLPKVAPQLKPK